MKTYNAKIDVTATAKSISDIQAPDGSPIDVSTIGMTSMVIQPKDGSVKYKLDGGNPGDAGAFSLSQGESLEISGGSLSGFRVVAGTATTVSVEIKYLQ